VAGRRPMGFGRLPYSPYRRVADGGQQQAPGNEITKLPENKHWRSCEIEDLIALKNTLARQLAPLVPFGKVVLGRIDCGRAYPTGRLNK
jgi:hypothetical protein